MTANSSRPLDTRYDVFLDHIRDHRQPAVVEALASWVIALACLVYYTIIYYRTPIPPRLPLMTEAKSLELASAEELHANVQLILHQLGYEGNRQQLVDLIRGNSKLRRLVSRFMLSENASVFTLQKVLQDVWPDLLALPPPVLASAMFRLSLIVPTHKESAEHVAVILNNALQHCTNPLQIQVVIVDAGLCTGDFGSLVTAASSSWAEVKLVHYTGGGGRGPALNFGALCANGSVLTFLHSDCLLPAQWDATVLWALRTDDRSAKRPTIQACAFSLDMDLSRHGLAGGSFPWGIRGVRVMANMRSRLCRMPYGDQGISLPASYFRYIGGFPNQPIMEDLEFMDYLRRRSGLLDEQVTILWSSCRCSPRRWQKVGVVYMTLANAMLVHRYTRQGWMPEDVFDYYYRRPFKKED